MLRLFPVRRALAGVSEFLFWHAGTHREPFNSTPMGVKSISFGSLHVRCTPMWALSTCGAGPPNEIKKNTRPKNITAVFRG